MVAKEGKIEGRRSGTKREQGMEEDEGKRAKVDGGMGEKKRGWKGEGGKSVEKIEKWGEE